MIGVYYLPEFPPRVRNPSRLAALSPKGPAAGRGYDCTNLALEPALDSLLAEGEDFALAFYYEDDQSRALAGFPLYAKNLSAYPGTGFQIVHFPVGGILPSASSISWSTPGGHQTLSRQRPGWLSDREGG